VTPLLKVADLGSRARQYTPGRDTLRTDLEEKSGHYLLHRKEWLRVLQGRMAPYTHGVRNLDPGQVKSLIVASEVFDPKNPETLPFSLALLSLDSAGVPRAKRPVGSTGANPAYIRLEGGDFMRFRPYAVVIASLLAAPAFGFFVSGGFLYKAIIGLDPAGFPAGQFLQELGESLLPPGLDVTVSGVVLALGSLLGMAVIAFFLVRASVRARVAETDPDRRRFLTGAASGAGVALGSLVVGAGAAVGRARPWLPVGEQIFGGEVVKTHPEWKEAWKGSRIRNYRRFGRTGFMVSEIVEGAGPLRQEADAIPRLAIERGVNYIDTSPDYSATGSEIAVGRALQSAGRRDQLFLATKWCTPAGHLPAGTPVADYMAAVEGSLSRLGTDYVDLVHVHACDEIPRLMDENMHEAFDRLEEDGKVRFLGFSSHTPNLVEVANTAIDSGRFDVMMLAYHHGIWSKLDDVIARARKEADMGVVAMKTLKGARHHGLEGFREESDAYSQAALKWALSNPNVSCAVISFFELQHVDGRSCASTTSRSSAATARPTVARAWRAARRGCPSTTCCASACTSRTMAGRRKACASTPSCRSTPRRAAAVQRRAWAAVRWESRSPSGRRVPTSCSDSRRKVPYEMARPLSRRHRSMGPCSRPRTRCLPHPEISR
jgi:aryl-alcohol dehydrogenase-like predicted oxidoreductase